MSMLTSSKLHESRAVHSLRVVPLAINEFCFAVCMRKKSDWTDELNRERPNLGSLFKWDNELKLLLRSGTFVSNFFTVSARDTLHKQRKQNDTLMGMENSC